MNNGWQTRRLGDLCEIKLGKTPARANEEFWDQKRETSNVWLSIADLLNADDNVVVDSKEYLTDKGAAISKTVRKGTLLASFKLTLGRLAFAGRDLFTNEAIAALNIFNEHELSKEFLFYFLHFFDWDKATEGDVKLKGKTLNKAKLKEMAVHFPPLAEQRRIVGILDEVFEGIATAKSHADKNLQNARAVFESHLNAVFTQRGEGWVEKRLAEICVLQRGFDLPTRSRVPGDFPLVSSSGVIHSHNEGPVSGPGVATGRSGSIGNVFYIEDDYWPLNTVLYVKEFHGNNPKFVYRLLSHFDLRRFATGAGVPTLNRNFVHDERLVVPESKTVQKKIAEQFDGIEQETQRLESIYQQKLTALKELKKSLLHQAFTGAL